MSKLETSPDRLPLVKVIGGPTASGKSRAAVALAAADNGVVINADAMQVYKDLAILSARPGAEETSQVPHEVFAVLDAAERCSAARWRDLAINAISQAIAGGQQPYIVGGTGLYLSALMHGLSPVPPVPRSVTVAAESLFDDLGPDQFRGKLAELDPERARMLSPTDRQRVVRAYAVAAATGKSLTEWHRRPREAPHYRFDVALIVPDRTDLYAACDARFETMVAHGALEEVEGLLKRQLDPSLPIMKCLGFRELAATIQGQIDLPEAISRAQQATRQYAKRQLTWCRHQVPDANIYSHYKELSNIVI